MHVTFLSGKAYPLYTCENVDNCEQPLICNIEFKFRRSLLLFVVYYFYLGAWWSV